MEIKKYYCEKCGETHARYVQCQINKQRIEELKQMDLENYEDLFKSKILESYGLAAVEGANEIKKLIDNDLTNYFNNIDDDLEEESIKFYINKCIKHLNEWIVISHHSEPTDKMSLMLLFKIIDRIKEVNNLYSEKSGIIYNYDRNGNKIKIYIE